MALQEKEVVSVASKLMHNGYRQNSELGREWGSEMGDRGVTLGTENIDGGSCSSQKDVDLGSSLKTLGPLPVDLPCQGPEVGTGLKCNVADGRLTYRHVPNISPTIRKFG